jgi:hypothetical protein
MSKTAAIVMSAPVNGAVGSFLLPLPAFYTNTENESGKTVYIT